MLEDGISPEWRARVSREALEALYEAIQEGFVSIRYAANLLDWDVDTVCEAVFGDVVL